MSIAFLLLCAARAHHGRFRSSIYCSVVVQDAHFAHFVFEVRVSRVWWRGSYLGMLSEARTSRMSALDMDHHFTAMRGSCASSAFQFPPEALPALGVAVAGAAESV